MVITNDGIVYCMSKINHMNNTVSKRYINTLACQGTFETDNQWYFYIWPYCMTKMSRALYSNSLFKMGQDFFDIYHVSLWPQSIVFFKIFLRNWSHKYNLLYMNYVFLWSNFYKNLEFIETIFWKFNPKWNTAAARTQVRISCSFFEHFILYRFSGCSYTKHENYFENISWKFNLKWNSAAVRTRVWRSYTTSCSRTRALT